LKFKYFFSLIKMIKTPGLLKIIRDWQSIEKLFKECGFNKIETTRIMPGSAFYSVLAS